jgi:monoterpene epsilon-lactone hydrolase
VRRLPLPRGVYTNALREARRPLPPGKVQKTHAVDVEMIGRTRCVWLDRHLADRGIVVHLHSGAFVSGPFQGDWEWLSGRVDTQQCAGLMIDYRFAPDHQHPVALDDTLAVLDTLAGRGILGGKDAAPWVISGFNAGAGLAAATLCSVRDGRPGLQNTIPLPSLLVAMSPWLDLELNNTGITETGHRDFPQERRMLAVAAQAYAGRTPLDDPLLSPVNADLRGLPPVHLSVGTKDIFLTDTRVARLQLEQADLEVSYREVAGRLGVLPWFARTEDTGRLLREQDALIAGALGR